MCRRRPATTPGTALLGCLLLITALTACDDGHAGAGITPRNVTLLVTCSTSCEIRFQVDGRITVSSRDMRKNNCSVQSSYGRIDIVCPQLP